MNKQPYAPREPYRLDTLSTYDDLKALRLALARRQFVVHYQPKIDLDCGRVTGLEALLRWKLPEVGMIQPNDFIRSLEHSGLIVAVGRWLLDQIAADRRHWSSLGLWAPRVSFNVSAFQFRQRDFVTTISRVLHDGLAGIDIEIPENALLNDPEDCSVKLHALHELGVRIAIDDFGTGHASIRHLAQLPLDSLKIDRSLIDDLSCAASRNLVAGIVGLARGMNLTVVAEGVETETQRSFLRDLQCHEMQGYLFSRPQPRHGIEKVLRLMQQDL